MIVKTPSNGYWNTIMTKKQEFVYKSFEKEGWSAIEIAEFMDISRNSVYIHLNAARTKIRRWGKELSQRETV